MTLTGQYQLEESIYKVDWINLNLERNATDFNRICEDGNHVLWISSASGLLAFDGNQTIVYQSVQDKYNLSHADSTNHFNFIDIAQDSILVTQTYNKREIIGFNTYSRDTCFIVLNDRRPDLKYLSPSLSTDDYIYQFAQSTVSNYGILERINLQGHVEIIYEFELDETESIYDFETLDGYVYCLSKNNIYVLNTETKLLRKTPNSDPVYSFLIRSSSEVFLLSEKLDKLYTIDGESSHIAKVWEAPIPLDNAVLKFRVFGDQLITSYSTFVVFFDLKKKTMQDLTPQFQLLANRGGVLNMDEKYNEIIKSKDGSFYLVSHSNILRVKKSPNLSYHKIKFQGLMKSPSMRAITQDNNGLLYASYYGGVAVSTGDESSFRSLDLRYPNNNRMRDAFSLSYWNNTLINNNTLIDLGTNKVTKIQPQVSYKHSEHVIVEDTLWMINWASKFLTKYNLSAEDLKEFPIHHCNGQPVMIREANKMTWDENTNCFWLSTNRMGLLKINKAGEILASFTFENFGLEPKINDHIHFHDNIFLAAEKGLIVLDSKTGESKFYTSQYINNQGHKDKREIYSIIPYHEENKIMLGTNYGLLLFDTKNHAFLELEQIHPMSQVEFNRKSIFSTKDRYYIGTINGLYALNHQDITWQREIAELGDLQLISVGISDKDEDIQYRSSNLDKLDHLLLTPNNSELQIQFSAPCHDTKVYYSYRIPTISNNWSDYTASNQISLYNIPAGEHELEIKASVSQSDSNVKLLTLGISKKEIWYKRWWAIMGCFLIAALIFYGIYRYRLAEIKKYEKLRTRISSDLHDDVGTLLSSLAIQSEMLGLEADSDKVHQFVKLSHVSREAMGRMRDTVWAIDSSKDTSEDLIERMQDFLLDTLELKEIDFDFDYSRFNKNSKIAPDLRQNVYLIFKEAITNIIKHSQADHVNIILWHQSSKIWLTIKDNGQVDPNKIKHSGTGTNNMKMRAKRIQSKIEIDFENGYSISLKPDGIPT